MIYTISGDNYYTNGLYLVYAIGFYLIRLKWINATLAFFMVLIFFITIGMFTSSLSNIDIYIHTFFYLSFAIIGIFGGYYNDKFNKEQYIYEVENERNESKLKDRINIQLKKLNDSHKATIVSIATLAESRDILTGNHLSRVATLSTMFAERIPEEFYTQNGVVKEEFLESIELTSILHDIGKIAVSDKILNKPAKLSHDEYETIKTHTTIGAKTLAMIKETDRDNLFVSQGIEIAQHHHERWDGLGYPNGLSGNDIPLSARIVAIIDVYDALISKRPYKEKFSKSKSISIIKEGKSTMFDPTLTDIFTKMAENSNNIELFWK
jgi:response regulator RpfG family c-di-GMP phosphodiesterase